MRRQLWTEEPARVSPATGIVRHIVIFVLLKYKKCFLEQRSYGVWFSQRNSPLLHPIFWMALAPWIDTTAFTEIPFPTARSVSGLLTPLIYASVSLLVQGANSPVAFFLRIFLHICLSVWCSVFLPTLSFLHRGTSLAVHNLHDFTVVSDVRTSAVVKSIFSQASTLSSPSAWSSLLAFSPSLSLIHWHLPASRLQHQLCLSLEWCQSDIENVPAFLTLSLTDCLINLLILSIMDLAGMLERRPVAHGWSLSLFSFV